MPQIFNCETPYFDQFCRENEEISKLDLFQNAKTLTGSQKN